MGSHFKQISFILIFTSLSINLSTAMADEGEEFFKALRKNPNAMPEEIQKLKYETYDKAIFKKNDELNKQNAEHTKKIESIKPPKDNFDDEDENPSKAPMGKVATGTAKPTSAPAKPALTPAKPVSTPAKATSDSGPVKVDSNMPEEMEFSGSTDEDAETHAPEKTKKADASAPAPTKK